MKERFNFKINSDPDHIWFTSDTHFGHSNILKFVNRPYANIKEHDECLIDNWNSVVNPDDTIFHLGDFAFASPGYIREVVSKLNGKIILIIGNHDWKNLNQSTLELFDKTAQQLYIQINGRKVLLNHYPILCFAGTYRKDEDRVYQLFGHVHSGPNTVIGQDLPRLEYLFKNCQYDVGVDNNNFRPISFTDVDRILNS